MWKAHKRQADDRSESGRKAFPPATHTHTRELPLKTFVVLVRRRRDLRDQQQCRMPNSKKSLMKPCSSAGCRLGREGVKRTWPTRMGFRTQDPRTPGCLRLEVYPCLMYRHRLDVCFHSTDSSVANSVALPFPQEDILRMGRHWAPAHLAPLR
jgi:hypothetical protein